MIQVFLPFITAIGLSAVAAYYSVIGLAQIFPGSFWPIILMGSILEISKLVTVSWLYNNWKETFDNSNPNGWTIKYFKGLGTSTSAEFKEYFANKKKLDIDILTDRFIVLRKTG